jgi:hypothetical protein
MMKVLFVRMEDWKSPHGPPQQGKGCIQNRHAQRDDGHEEHGGN